MTGPGYQLSYHPLVVKRDIPKLGAAVRRKIQLTIEQKLQQRPDIYGWPLRGTLKGYWKLRIGDYRVVYEVAGNNVYISIIAHRRVVYDITNKRIGKEK